MSHVTQEELLELFDYKDGDLIWKNNRGSNKTKGQVAGTPRVDGYKMIRFKNKGYLTHRLIWIWHNGSIKDTLEIDHIDRDRSNNNISNLRLVNRSQNLYNMGAKGCSYRKSTGKWLANIGFGKGCKKFLGSFDTEQEAHEAYLEAKRHLHKI